VLVLIALDNRSAKERQQAHVGSATGAARFVGILLVQVDGKDISVIRKSLHQVLRAAVLDAIGGCIAVLERTAFKAELFSGKEAMDR
jgi:hypothetical protein